MHLDKVTDLPQAKLDSEKYARFLSNEHGDRYFLLHKFGVKIILITEKKFVKRKTNTVEPPVAITSRKQTPLLRDQCSTIPKVGQVKPLYSEPLVSDHLCR